MEICINNAWGTICDSGFTKEEAKVACRQLGLLQIEGKVPLAKYISNELSNAKINMFKFMTICG